MSRADCFNEGEKAGPGFRFRLSWFGEKETHHEIPSEALRNRLMEQYLSLVKYNAERIFAMLPDEVELNDLVSAGIFGLKDAIDALCARGDSGRAAQHELDAVAGPLPRPDTGGGGQVVRGRIRSFRRFARVRKDLDQNVGFF